LVPCINFKNISGGAQTIFFEWVEPKGKKLICGHSKVVTLSAETNIIEK
jgi:hypothetical protein